MVYNYAVAFSSSYVEIFTKKYTTLRTAEQENKTRKGKQKKNHKHLKSKHMSGLRPISLSFLSQAVCDLPPYLGNPMKLMLSFGTNLLC
jgi:hypothetical protein